MNELTPDQEQFIRDNYSKMSDLNELTRNCYNDTSLDGRTTKISKHSKVIYEKNLAAKQNCAQKKTRL